MSSTIGKPGLGHHNVAKSGITERIATPCQEGEEDIERGGEFCLGNFVGKHLIGCTH